MNRRMFPYLSLFQLFDRWTPKQMPSKKIKLIKAMPMTFWITRTDMMNSSNHIYSKNWRQQALIRQTSFPHIPKNSVSFSVFPSRQGKFSIYSITLDAVSHFMQSILELCIFRWHSIEWNMNSMLNNAHFVIIIIVCVCISSTTSLLFSRVFLMTIPQKRILSHRFLLLYRLHYYFWYYLTLFCSLCRLVTVQRDSFIRIFIALQME